MPALWMEFGQDLVQNAQGGLLMAYGADEVRQAICRQLLTTPALTLDNGTTVAGEVYTDPTFGVGLRVLVGQNAYDGWLAALTQKINNCVLKTPGVNPSIPPTVQTTEVPSQHLVNIVVSYTLASGAQSSLAFQVAGV